jgi:large subunit ribosomal protein L23
MPWKRSANDWREEYPMNDPFTIIQTMLVTEQSMDLKESGKYVFKVHPDANKIEIRKAVEKLYDVKVKSVNVMNRLGKRKRAGRARAGFRTDWKKAVVTLTQGSIDIL